MCAGYFRYDRGHRPDFPGEERYGGTLVHPQHWPGDLDYTNRNIVIIGSGATAVTLLPELAKRAEHVTMLQRSPTYMIAFPDRDLIANILRKVLPERLAYRLTRWKNIRLQTFIFKLARKRPNFVRRLLVGHARRMLGKDFDVDRHFNPAYNPWEQRLCLVPNDDLFEAIKSGKASVVTDQIRTFTDTGIELESGERLDADIIVTATGLEISVLGGVQFSVDGEPVDFADRVAYKGVMMRDVPNMISTFGYINASWTLRADLVAQFACRVLDHMQAGDFASVTPRLRASDTDMPMQPYLTGFSSGYLARVMHRLPKQGDREPWLNPQDYLGDRERFLEAPLDDGVLEFAAAGERRSRDTDERKIVNA
jgi:cation diffusion facilitator CzcD-associated flavoprotein CzcO